MKFSTFLPVAKLLLWPLLPPLTALPALLLLHLGQKSAGPVAQEDIFLHCHSPGVSSFWSHFLCWSGCTPSVRSSCLAADMNRGNSWHLLGVSTHPSYAPSKYQFAWWLTTQLLHAAFGLLLKHPNFLKLDSSAEKQHAHLTWPAAGLAAQPHDSQGRQMTAKCSTQPALKACHSQFYPLRLVCHFDALPRTGGGSWKVVHLTVRVVFQTHNKLSKQGVTHRHSTGAVYDYWAVALEGSL